MNWTDLDILDYYDSHWDVTIGQLSRMTGRAESEIKELLLKNR